MARIFKYRIWCNADNKYEYVYLSEDDPAPTTCPTNAGHSIGDVSIESEISSEDVIVSNEIIIQEEISTNKTGGHFKIAGFDFDVPASIGVFQKDFLFPTARALLSAHVHVSSDWVNDVVAIHVAPDSIIGTISSAGAINDTVFDVQQSVIDNIMVGYLVQVDNQKLGECVSIDPVNLQITTENGLTSAVQANDYVKITVEMVKNIKFTVGGVTKNIGESKIGSSYLPAGQVLRVVYDNKTAVEKKFHFNVEMLY
jgi:hypothetical protein